MNMIELQERLKDLSDQRLTQEMQAPSDAVPQFLVLNELNRRKRMRADLTAMQAQPEMTVAEEAVASAGVPASGIATMAQMAPRSAIAQNTGVNSLPQEAPPQEAPPEGMYGGGMVRRMYGGGPVRMMQQGGLVRRMQEGGPTSPETIVRSGRVYYLQPDGTYISADGRSFSDVGTNLSNFASGIMGALGMTPGAGSTPPTSVIQGGRAYYLQSDGTYLSGDGRRLSDVGTNLRNLGSDLGASVSGIGQDVASALTPSPDVARPFDPSLSPQFSGVPAGAVDRPFGLPTTNRQLDAIIASQNAVPDLSDAAAMQFGQTPAGEMPPRNSSVLNDMALRAQLLAGDTSNMMPTGGPGTFPVPEMGRTAADDMAIRAEYLAQQTPPQAQQSVDGMTGYVPPSDGTASGDMELRANLSGGEGRTPTEIFRETLDRYLPETAPTMPGLPSLQQRPTADALPYVEQPAIIPTESPGDYIPSGLRPPAGPAGMPMTSTGPLTVPAPNVSPTASTSDEAMRQFEENFGIGGGTGVSFTLPQGDMSGFAEDFGMPAPVDNLPGAFERIFGAPALERAGIETSRTRQPAPLPVIDELGGRRRDDIATLSAAAETPEDIITSAPPIVAPEVDVTSAPPSVADTGISALTTTAAPVAAVPAMAAPSVAGAAPTGGAPSGIAGAAPAAATSFEQEILNAIQRQERRAEQDKWLALAQVGLGMMTSNSPTFLGALGEGGTAGLQALVGTRDANEARRMELAQALEEYRMMQSERAAARAGAGRPRAPAAPSLSDLQNRRDALMTTSQNEFGEDVEVPASGYESQVMLLDQMIAQAAMAGLPQQAPANLADIVGQ